LNHFNYLLLDFDIKDIEINENNYAIYCDIKSLESVKQAVEKAGLKIESSGLEWVSKNTLELPEDKTEKVLSFLSAIQDHDDVENVYTNLG